ncbi:MAG: glycoside hydrolase family 13 protein [Saprospiraceae bacterium]
MKRVLSFTCLFLFSILSIAQSIERVEPPNWWIGMNCSEIQVLVYGKNISNWNVVIKSDLADLQKVVKTENDNYLFVYLKVKENVKPGVVPLEFYEGKKLAETYNFELKEREANAADLQGFNTTDAIYLITPDRFANGDSSNDQFADMPDKLNRADKGGRHGGDLKGIQDNIDYIKDLGFTAIWLNPILENDMPKYSYHGYAATDFYKVDKRFGSNEDYVKFIAKAKSKGLKVIMDMILNHSGSKHWFVLDPPSSDWINNQNDFVQTSHKRQTIQDPYASEYDKKKFSDGWFVPTMPDLNQTNDLMADYLIQNTLWWIEYSKITGIRMDTYCYPDKDFMSDWTCAVMDEYPNFTIVGEEWSVNPAIVSYWQKDKVNHDGYTSCLPTVMDFPIQHALSDALSDEKESWNTGLIKLYEMLANDFLYSHPKDLVIFPDNHDMDRFFTQVGQDVDLFKMGLVYMATMRGIPQFYYGTEIAMDNKSAPGDHGIIRTDFPGGWKGDAKNGFTGEGLSAQEKDIKNFVTQLLNWRKTSAVIHYGDLIQFAPEDGVYAYVRTYEGKSVLVLFNKNEKEVRLDFEKFAEVIDLESAATIVVPQKPVNLKSEFTIRSNQTVIIEVR